MLIGEGAAAMDHEGELEMDLLERMADHRSVRRYSSVTVDDGTVEACVRAAQMAATSSHVQAYCAIRVRDPERRARLRELCGGQAMIEQAGAFLIVCGDLRRHMLLSARAGAEHRQSLESFLVAAVDASLFAQNLALAFESRGLGTCYIGGLRNQLVELDALLGLPEGVLPLYGLCVGQPAERPDRKPRLPLPAVLLEERYPEDEAMLALLDAFDAEMEAHYADRGQPGRVWSEGIVRKHEQVRRSYLADYYRDKGARLD